MTPQVEIAAEELRSWIAASARKRRRIRSGAFWRRFGVGRRTNERVSYVLNALSQNNIDINLDLANFGSEKRGEVIILSLSDQLPSARSEVPGAASAKTDYESTRRQLSHLTHAIIERHYDVQYRFSILFAELFWNETPNYELSPNVFGATRSNWTYHTANAISQTSKILELTCKFEVGGKRDAIIEDGSEVVIVAEWEWDYHDIFGRGKELEKLRDSCRQNGAADALLLVYCPDDYYLEFIQRIAEFWVEDDLVSEQRFSLFLHVVIFNERKGLREFDRLKTLVIHRDGIEIWGEKYVDEELEA